MKLTLTKDFKRSSKVLVALAVVIILVHPVIHLIKGDFCWKDTLSNALWALLVFWVLELIMFFVPRKAAKYDQ